MYMVYMNLRDIEYFAAIAEHRHLGRAAEALGLGQPALSISLRRLEKAADAKLVVRKALNPLRWARHCSRTWAG
jgi:LysR family hydrogen peroxide-inducible transcriptional activator